MPSITLISHTPDPEKLVACAAKLCYSSSHIDETYKKLTKENTEKFLNILSELGHESPLEHISFTFGVEGVSRAFLAQITRHRIASYSVQSQRYVRLDGFEYIIPPEIESDESAKDEFLNTMNIIGESYKKLAQILKKNQEEKLMSQNIDEKTAEKFAEKIAIEDARFVLPNACETKMIFTFNARSLLNLFRHRCCNRAQWEIQSVCTEMLKIVKTIAPSIFMHAGPPCLSGKCPEGKMSCGKMLDIKEKFGNTI